MLSELWRGLFDRRCRFYDVRRLAPEKRKPRSSIVQFYSSANNIGNFLPVLGIQDMLGCEPDCWCAHDREIDFDFINSHYRCAVIGGAGLLHSCFGPFWEAYATKCRIPTVIWGVGGCFPDGDPNAGVDRKVVHQVVQRCDLINVRDELTRDHYSLEKAHISPCPTIVHLESFKPSSAGNKRVLFSSHEELTGPKAAQQIHEVLGKVAPGYLYTDNTQHRRLGLSDIVRRYYCAVSLVVTTRLHGAIIAYGLSVPYVAVARDEKLRDFHRLYGNGVLLENVAELADTIREQRAQVTLPIQFGKVREFGGKAKEWLSTLGVQT